MYKSESVETWNYKDRDKEYVCLRRDALRRLNKNECMMSVRRGPSPGNRERTPGS